MAMMGEGKWAMNVLTVTELIKELQKYPPQAIIECVREGNAELYGQPLLSEVVAIQCRPTKHGEVSWMEDRPSNRPEYTNIVALKFEEPKGNIRSYLSEAYRRFAKSEEKQRNETH
jgi:hypothetical protein